MPLTRKPIVITGTKKEPGERVRLFAQKLVQLSPAEYSFIVGGAKGVDISFAMVALAFDFQVHAVLPGGGAQYAEFAELYCKDYEFAPAKSSHPASLLHRNVVMLERSWARRLWAFPRTEREELRSGTWATVRAARKRDFKIEIFPLGL
jgi:hypothetical protein